MDEVRLVLRNKTIRAVLLKENDPPQRFAMKLGQASHFCFPEFSRNVIFAYRKVSFWSHGLVPLMFS